MKTTDYFRKPALAALCLTLLAAAFAGCDGDDDFWDAFIPETDKEPTSAQIQGYVFYPALQPASDANVAQLKVPAGFKLNKFAEGLGKPRILVKDGNGHVFASDREAGIVMMLTDSDNDGVADDKKTVANIKQVHGLHVYNSRM